jgi:hypothetical protein
MKTDGTSIMLERGAMMSLDDSAGRMISVRSRGVTLASALKSSVLEVRASPRRRAFEGGSVVRLNFT